MEIILKSENSYIDLEIQLKNFKMPELTAQLNSDITQVTYCS